MALVNFNPTSIARTFFEKNLSAITTDSRQAKPGSLFVAIQGDQHDGHNFILKAIESGASAVLGESSKLSSELLNQIPSHVTVYKVESSLQAIRSIAKEYKSFFKIPFVGVVGSVGKTTTKEMISSILSGKFSSILKTEGSQNGFLGIAITLLELKTHHEVAVIEIGIDEIGAMDEHLALVEPNLVICTATGPEHLHQLKTVEIAAAEEIKALEYGLQNGQQIAVNLDDSYIAAFAKKHQIKENDRIKLYALQNYSQETLEVGGETYRLPLPGEHHARNLLGAIQVAKLLGLNHTEITKGLATFKAAFGRTNIVQKSLSSDPSQSFLLIEDFYNSNPTSCEAALKLLASKAQKQTDHTIAVLGDMLELGEQEEQFHRELAKVISTLNIRTVFLYGPRMKWLKDELSKTGFKGKHDHFESHESLGQSLKTAITHTTGSTTVLLKGSRGMKMETVLKSL